MTRPQCVGEEPVIFRPEGESGRETKLVGGLCPMERYAHHTDGANGPPPPMVLIGMILPISRGNVPWTMVRGQLRLQKTRMIAAVRHTTAPTQNEKTAAANRSSILLDRSAH